MTTRARRFATLAALACATACGNDAKAIDAAAAPTPDAEASIDAKPVQTFDAPVDAKPADAMVDAKPSSVQVLASCSGANPALTVTISSTPQLHYVLSYAQGKGPDSIAPNDVVEFITQSVHDATSGSQPGTPDGVFRVDFSKDQCLKFTQVGSFPFYCSFHLFTATIVVK